MDRPRGQKAPASEPSHLRITQVRGTAGRPEKQRRVIAGLGLGRVGRTVVRENSESVRGMVAKIPHLLQVEPADGGGEGS